VSLVPCQIGHNGDARRDRGRIDSTADDIRGALETVRTGAASSVLSRIFDSVELPPYPPVSGVPDDAPVSKFSH
jgi:hypothetical protein